MELDSKTYISKSKACAIGTSAIPSLLSAAMTVMQKAQLLCTLVPNQISETVLDEVERIALLRCQTKGATVG